MGRAPKYERQQFQDIGLPKQNNRQQLECKHCLLAYNTKSALKLYLHVQLRLQNHLKTCQFYQEALKSGCVQLPQVVPDVINGFKRQLSVANERVETSTTSSDKRQRYIREYFDNLFTEEKQEEFERLLVQFQADNCLPDRFVEKGPVQPPFQKERN
ncbi:hypothetical protein GN958_ATG05707 [Phytophthora infestans]|uniref:Uncharacterized protein n=1 Tax=Phytophthora infestans TaxID=4787 RepID=A0A8S9V106_PHYIN|nr:hypothetical protein GN958_ATG05707 [Phytophthora infestans]